MKINDIYDYITNNYYNDYNVENEAISKSFEILQVISNKVDKETYNKVEELLYNTNKTAFNIGFKIYRLSKECIED